MEKTMFLIKVKEEVLKSTENSIASSLIDRLGICQPLKSFSLYKQKGFSYIVLQGDMKLSIPILESIRKRLNKKKIDNKIFKYKLDNSKEFANLVTTNISCNKVGYIIENYDSESLMMKSIKRLTNKFLVEKRIASKYIFCPNCKEGYGDMVTLTSLKSHYYCSFCDTNIIVKGPLITKKVDVSHLSKEEAEFIIKNYNLEVEGNQKTKKQNNYISVEQIMWPQIKRIKPIDNIKIKCIKRNRNFATGKTNTIEQLSLNIS